MTGGHSSTWHKAGWKGGHHKPPLTDEQLAGIRDDLRHGMTHTAIAKKWNRARSSISSFAEGKTYTWLR